MLDSFIGLQVADVLHTTVLSRVNVSWFFWLMEKPPFVEGGFFFLEDCRGKDCRMIGKPPSYTQITESFSVNLLARPDTIFLVIGDAYNTAAVYDGNCTKTRISGGQKVG